MDGKRAASTITINSQKIDRLKLEALEAILYGEDGGSPRMPDPVEVLNLVQRLSVERMLIDVLSTHDHWLWDTFNFREHTVPIAIENESRRHIYYDPEAGTTFIQPSITYHLVSETQGSTRYMIYIIDEKHPSQLAVDASETLDMTLNETFQSGGFYYYSYNLYV